MANGASKGAMTKIFTYSRTMKSTSDYATNMKRLSAQIFGEVGQRIYLFFRILCYNLYIYCRRK